MGYERRCDFIGGVCHHTQYNPSCPRNRSVRKGRRGHCHRFFDESANSDSDETGGDGSGSDGGVEAEHSAALTVQNVAFSVSDVMLH